MAHALVLQLGKYGDLSPTTMVGRVVAVVLMHLTTLLLMPLLTAEIAAKLIVDRDAFTHDEPEQIKAALVRLETKVDPLSLSMMRSQRIARPTRLARTAPIELVTCWNWRETANRT